MQTHAAQIRGLKEQLERQRAATAAARRHLHVHHRRNGELLVVLGRERALPVLKTTVSHGLSGGRMYSAQIWKFVLKSIGWMKGFQNFGVLMESMAHHLLGVNREKVPSKSWMKDLRLHLKYMNLCLLAFLMMFKLPGELQLHHDGTQIWHQIVQFFAFTCKVDATTSVQLMVRTS